MLIPISILYIRSRKAVNVAVRVSVFRPLRTDLQVNSPKSGLHFKHLSSIHAVSIPTAYCDDHFRQWLIGCDLDGAYSDTLPSCPAVEDLDSPR